MRRLLLGLGLIALVACDGLSEFRTEPGEVFQGAVIGDDKQDDGAFIHSGFPGGTVLALTFDPSKAVPPEETAEPAGTLTSYTCSSESCGEDDRKPGAFDEAELEPIPQLSHDALGVYELPGSNRLRNYIFGARFSSGTGLLAVQRHAMVFLSLMEDGRVEVRIIAPSILAADGHSTLHPALFGVFSLARRHAS